MSIGFVKPLVLEKIVEESKERIEWNRLSSKVCRAVIAGLESEDGKKITKRLEGKVRDSLDKEGLSSMPVRYTFNYGMYNIEVRISDSGKNPTLSFLIGYDSSPVVNLKKIIESNQGYLQNDLPADRLEYGIQPKNPLFGDKSSKASVLVDRWNAALAEMQKINKEAEEIELQYTFDLNVRS
jgi:hypothetical protein